MDTSLKHTFGLEITNNSLRAVELAVSPLGVRVVNFSAVDLEPDTVEDDCIIINPETFKKALGTLLLEGENGPFFSKNVIICVPEEKTFSHLLSIPREKANDRAFILNLAKDFIPIDLTEAIVDYKPLKSAPGDKEIRFNFVAIQKNIVQSLIQILGETGLQVTAVDVSKNSLLRVCDNRFQKNEGDFMVINIEPEISLFTVATENGATYTVDSKIAGNACMEKIKKQFNIATLHEAKSLVLELAKNPEAPKMEVYGQIKELLKDNFQMLAEKAKSLIRVAEEEENLNLKSIYLIGTCSRGPGLKEALQDAFFEQTIINMLDYVSMGEMREIHFAKAIGLALRAILLETEETDINLLPPEKKVELDVLKYTPIILRRLVGITAFFGLLMVLLGVMAWRQYFALQAGQLENRLWTEKLQNPYLTQTVQAREQKFQLESQISALMKDAVPASQVMRKLDSFNFNGVSMVNATYDLNAKKEIEVHFRAKTADRDATEKFIMALESDPYFTNVVSPLSNLVGKGERFINIDLALDTDTVIADFEKMKQQEVESLIQEKITGPKKPAAPAPTQPINP